MINIAFKTTLNEQGMKIFKKIFGSLAGFLILLTYSLIMAINITFFSIIIGLSGLFQMAFRKFETFNYSILVHY